MITAAVRVQTPGSPYNRHYQSCLSLSLPKGEPKGEPKEAYR
jgi:hypothetical protein